MFLKTSDGIKIAYDLYDVADPKGYIILAPMMPATKESWRDFANFTQKQGYSSIAIDLRGHGQSEGGPNGYENFSDNDHQKSIRDIEAAVEFLKNKGARPDRIILVGASIGANLSLKYLADHPEFKKAVLLSAGLDYRGIKTEPLCKKLKSDQKILAVSAKDDDDNAAENIKLFGRDNPNLIVYDQGGHGTTILENHPELIKEIIQWL